jgi:hypothetical protein
VKETAAIAAKIRTVEIATILGNFMTCLLEGLGRENGFPALVVEGIRGSGNLAAKPFLVYPRGQTRSTSDSRPVPTYEVG